MIWLAVIAAALGAEHRYAVVIGHNHGDVDEPSLLYAQSDAQRFAEVLETVGSLPLRNLVSLMDPDAAEVEGALERLSRELGALPEDDQVLVFAFYSGHADAMALHLGGSRLALDELAQRVEDLPADARVLVLDACRAGGLTQRKGGTGIAPFEIAVEARSNASGMAIITSSAAGEDAQESDLLRGGVFSHHLIAGLRGAADTNEDGIVTLSESFRYAADQTLATTSQVAELQHPSFRFDLSGSADLVITRTLDAAQLGHLRAVQQGRYLLFDPRGRDLFVEVEMDAGGVVAVPPGDYLVRRHSPRRIEESRIEVAAGQTQSIEGLEPVPLGQATRRRGTERRAWGLQAGGGLAGPLLTDQSWGPAADFGVRMDTRWMGVLASVRGSRSQGENELLVQTQSILGGELGLMYLADLHTLSLGPEVRAGASAVIQQFDSAGLAPPATALAGHVGMGARLEWSPAARMFVALDGGADMVFVPEEQHPGETIVYGPEVVPRVSLELGLWVH